MLVASQHGPCNHEANNPEDEARQHSPHRVFTLALKQHDAADDPDNLREDGEQQEGGHDVPFLAAEQVRAVIAAARRPWHPSTECHGRGMRKRSPVLFWKQLASAKAPAGS